MVSGFSSPDTRAELLALGYACLGCVHTKNEQEISHEESVAFHLGVSVDDVRSERIDATAAALIQRNHPHLDSSLLVGTAYDSLYKSLCSTDKLKKLSGEQVVARASEFHGYEWRTKRKAELIEEERPCLQNRRRDHVKEGTSLSHPEAGL